MPLLLDKNIDSHTRIAVWKNEETNSFFEEALKLTAQEIKDCEDMKPHRQREWLSSRYLLDLISEDNQRVPLIKTSTGKPTRKSCAKCISISHSRDYVAVMISELRSGIDIQREEAKIAKIAHKFISNEEFKHLPKQKRLPYYHVFWGAKESMYKAYGLNKLEFREHMHLYPFRLYDKKVELRGWVRKDDVSQDYDVYMEELEETYLVYCIMSTKE